MRLNYDKHNEDSLFRTLETVKSPASSSVLLNKLSSLLLPAQERFMPVHALQSSRTDLCQQQVQRLF